MNMEEIFLPIGKEPLEKKKRLMNLLHNANLPGSWEKFDKLDCAVSFSRQNDESMSFDEFYSLIDNDAIIVSSIYRKEWLPSTGEETRVMMFATRSVCRDCWLIPANLKGMLEKKGDIGSFRWMFYSGEYPEDKSLPRIKLDMEIQKNLRNWKKIGLLERKLADFLPAELEPDSPKALLKQLPIEIKYMIQKRKEDTERFYWYHCPHEGDNYKMFDGIFGNVYGSSVIEYAKAGPK